MSPQGESNEWTSMVDFSGNKISISKDGSSIALSHDQELKIYHDDGTPKGNHIAIQNLVKNIVISPDGNGLVINDSSGNVRAFKYTES